MNVAHFFLERVVYQGSMLGFVLSALAGAVGLFSLVAIRRSSTAPIYLGWRQKPGETTQTLSSPDVWQMAALFASIILKYVPGTAGYKARLLPDPSNEGFALPEIKLSGTVHITKRDIAAFESAVHRTDSQGADHPFLLVSLSTPLILFTLANHACPIRPLGAVNTRNRLAFRDVAFCRDSDAILAASGKGSLTYSCTFGGPSGQGRRLKRGVEFDIKIELKQEERTVLQQHLSFLQFLPARHPPRFIERDTKSDRSDAESGNWYTCPSRLSIKTSDPRRWAASCGDYNPIHISGLAAKAFGFRSVIAHGNYVVALALRDLTTSTTDTVHSEEGADSAGLAQHLFWIGNECVEVEVRFLKPVLLPAKLTVDWQANNTKNEVQMQLRGDRKRVHIQGHIRKSFL